MDNNKVTVIGAGLAGSEAAWQIAGAGVPVELYEMRPKVRTAAHRSSEFAELVCSNSLRGASLANAVGLLKEEMRRLNSLIMLAAEASQVPAGGALAVDREEFARHVTHTLESHPLITVVRDELTQIPTDGLAIIATGPLTSPALSEDIKKWTGDEYLYFYDAAAPIVTKESIDFSKVYVASRYDKGEASYINCPMTEAQFDAFYDALCSAETAPVKEFEQEVYFEGCMPVEVMAKRGRKTLLFGPLKPVGLPDPRTGQTPFAVVQLRQDNAAASLYNIVGFQTHLKWGEQASVFRMIPGLAQAEIVRYGVMHRNTYINSPRSLQPTYQLKSTERIFFAGQITGVEGYVESAAAGLAAGINAARVSCGQEPVVFPADTAIGSLARYITKADPNHFQPMNATFGLLPELEYRMRDKREKNERISARALESLQEFQQKHQLPLRLTQVVR
ncbi:MAG: trmFO [Bacilli bacterium]|nr:trmFO [Bacilli bacterium]